MYEDTLASIQEDFPHINGIQVYQDDDLVFETYQNGTSHETTNPVGCIFKSFIATAIGIAIHDTLIESVNQQILDFFPNIKPNSANMKSITIAHALTKTTGIAWPPPGADIRVDNMEAVFSLDLKNLPGEAFEYKPDPQMLVYLLEKITGRSFISYVNQNLFSPLGIQHYQWDTNMADIQDMRMPLYEIAKLGRLYLAQGQWNGRQVISPSFVVDSVTAHIEQGFPEQAGYGYLWWVSKIEGIPSFL